MAEITLERLTKVYGDGTRAVSELDLEIQDGEFVVLVGPSGCGKTSALRMVAGLEPITDGKVLIGGEVVNRLPPKDRDIAMIFQNYALYPHMSAFDNMAFGLKLRGMKKARRGERVNGAAKTLGLAEVLPKKPRTLSGGQRQRVAMGRAIVREPRAFLMDEPLSNLDAKLRVGMRASLAELHARLGVTTVYVTHDQTEAMTLGQRVAVMRDGVIVQVDEPQALYRRPRDVFVAAFIGSPSMNLVDATVENGAVGFGEHVVALDHRRPSAPTGRVVLGIRPEAFEDAAFAPAELPRVRIHVDVLEELGADTHACFHVRASRPSIDTGQDTEEASLIASETTLFTARIDPRTAAQAGTSLDLAVDPARFHFFDPVTGAALANGTDAPEPLTREAPIAANWS
jgi:multiple sugar transport system ATP-binding protein